jgi:tetratricopeptide (TPR) repeat protein
MYFRCEFYAIIGLVARYLPRVEALGDKKRLSRFLFESGYAHVFAREVAEGRELLARARALGEETGDDLAIAYADLGLMWDRIYWGEPSEARSAAQHEAAERLVEVGLRHRDIWLASKARLALAIDLLFRGRPNVARAELMKLMAMSRETNDPRPRAMALWALASLNATTGNFAEAFENADEALRVSLSPIDRYSALGFRSMGMVLSGEQVAEGVALAAQIVHELDTKGLTMTLVMPKLVMGVGTVMLGDMAHGMRMIEGAIAEGERFGQTAVGPMGDMFRGETYLQMAIGGDKPPLAVMLRNLSFLLRNLPFARAKARRYLERSVDGARTMDAPFFVARGLYDLALLDMAAKRTREARARFEQARAMATAVETTNLVASIDAAMAELSPS